MAINCGCKGSSNSSKYVIALFLIILLFITRACCDDHPHVSKRNNCSESERRALLAIKSDLYNSDHWLSSWTGYEYCKWRGVACDNTTNHVIRLDLHYPLDQYASFPSKSKINPSLFKLKHLKYLDLSFNNFSTHVPNMISSLVYVEHLNFSNANFNGLIPQQLGNLSKLRFLDLSCCHMDSRLWPDDLNWLSHLTSLEYLDMSCANLSTTISWFRQINYNSLEHLALSDCWLPDEIGAGSSMIKLNSTTNLIDGYISVNSTRKLKHLDLSLNLLTKIPLGMGILIHLEYLDLCLNMIREIPLSLGNLIRLEYLNLHFNKIIGEIPLSLGNLIRLEYLYLNGNQFSGEIPLNIGNLTNLIHLDISNNNYFGRISDVLGNLTGLLLLDVSSNEFSGCIPEALGNLVYLEELIVPVNNISCQIPESIGRLHNLMHLDASMNNLMGHLPLSLGDLCNLEFLDLSENNIGGELTYLLDGLSKCPQGSKLRYFDIHGNKFSGPIPSSLGQLAQLQILDFSSNSLRDDLFYFVAFMNNLMGQIPSSLGDLCNLEKLDLSDNNIGGELTNLLDGLSKCPQGSKLQYLLIRNNKFSGSIPSSLGQLAQLQHLDVSSNSLQGNMTDAHFSKLTNLLVLDISYNSLNLILSDDWLPPFHAFSIDMSYCHLGTRFPSWIQTQTTLEDLQLSGVGLYGNIPGWFSDFISNDSFYDLDISSNNLNGQLPSSLTISMDLSNNSFEGTIPTSYANFKHVEVLKLSNNHIYGNLPAFFCNLTELNVLHMSNNYLSGEVPNCHGSYPFNLHSLHLNNNNLSGPFPTALRNSNELIVLNLGGNKFSDEIPKWVGRSFPLLKILSLSSNSFHHAIPMNIGNFIFLQVLDLSFNNLVGSIPSSIANFSFMRVKQNYTPYGLHYPHFNACYYGFVNLDGNMEYLSDDNIIITAKGSTDEYTKALKVVTSIDMSNNELSGEIPKEITELHGLYFLNLSNNHLTGRIPENIGVMKELESLDLSMNSLMGEIPFTLSALNFLGSLNLSYNNLSGRIPTGSQLSTFNDTIYVGNEGLCGVPLPECPNDEANHSPSQGNEEYDEKLERALNFAFIIMGFIVGFWAYLGIIFMKKSTRITLFQMVDKMYDWMHVQLSLKFAKLKLKWQK